MVAQSNQLYFENYTSDQGLSQNSCFSIAQDAQGFMWFGTQDGLNRYDGKQFRVFLPQAGNGKKLPSNYISSLLFDQSKKILWVGTLGGICIYDTERDKMFRASEYFPQAAKLDTVSIRKVLSFRDNEYWILTWNMGMLLFNASSQKLTTYFGDSLSRTGVTSIVQHDGKLIVSCRKNLYHMAPQTSSNVYQPQQLMTNRVFPEIRELFSYHDNLWIGTASFGCYYVNNPWNENSVVNNFEKAKGGVGCFTTDASDNLWIGTRGNGVLQYNPFTQETKIAEHNRYDDRSLGKNFVLSLFRDRQGLIWCGLSGSGVAKHDPLKYQFRSISNDPVDPNSLPDDMVFDLFRCRDGSYYVGTQNKGIAEWLPEQNRFVPYYESSRMGGSTNTIYDITEDRYNNLWIASWGGLMQFNRTTKKLTFIDGKELNIAKNLYSVLSLNNADSLFIAGEYGAVFYSLRDKQFRRCPPNLLDARSNSGRYIYQDEQDIIWICTTGDGLVRYDYRSGVFERMDGIKQISGNVRHLLPNAGMFWLATDNGIVIYDPKERKVVKQILLNSGNSSNVCYAVQKDKKGFFWTSSNTGLYRINPDNYTVRNYDLVNGLSFLEYNTACVLKEPDGSLLFGGVGGITKFHPSMMKEDPFSPKPVITAISVNNTPLNSAAAISRLTELSLPHNKNFITFYFAVNNFSKQSKTQFEYRMKGLNDNWINSGNNNAANYTSLPPGDYTFELRSSNSDGKLSQEVARLTLVILPPWWQTWWFRVGAALAIATVITIGVRRRIANIRHEAELKHRIAETEMMALRAQMNPHFIFNCINSIDALIQSNDKYHATIYLNKFAKLIRNILDSSRQDSIPLFKDIDTLNLYIELEQLRNENKFTAEICADEQLLEHDYKVPPLIIQPFVENAILHGLRNRPDNEGKLTVSIKRHNGHLEYIVEDNGVGRNAQSNSLKKEKQSYGLQITNDRVKLFNEEEKASVEITDLSVNGKPSGTRVKVFLKIK
jgi:ligand-binding sensor domain-containing protein